MEWKTDGRILLDAARVPFYVAALEVRIRRSMTPTQTIEFKYWANTGSPALDCQIAFQMGVLPIQREAIRSSTVACVITVSAPGSYRIIYMLCQDCPYVPIIL
jgi:hypothetical protein